MKFSFNYLCIGVQIVYAISSDKNISARRLLDVNLIAYDR